MVQLNEQLWRLKEALHRRQLASFVAGAMPVLAPGERFRNNFHIAAIAHALEDVAAGRTRRLLITCPPRHLKSLIASVCFPAWLLGHDPRAKLVAVSHTAELAIKHHNDCRTLMASPYYRRLFTGTVLSQRKNTQTEFLTTEGGGRYSTSVGGPITGRGGRYIIIDDPMKADDAYSEVKREAVKDWYKKTLVSRPDDPSTSSVILVMQRLHEDDLAGLVLEQGGFIHLNLPAEAECAERIQIGPCAFYHRDEGELLHEERVPKAELNQIRASMGDDYSAQYQQRPAPMEGAIIKRRWIRRYQYAPERASGDEIVQSWDTAVKTGEKHDYSVCATFLRRGRVHYLINVHRARLEFPELLKEVVRLRREAGPGPLLIEDAGSGAQVLQALKADPRLPGAISIRPDGDKQTRLHGQSRKFEAGDVLLPQSAPWLHDLEAELLAFPKSRHDDQVDAISQYLRWSDKGLLVPLAAGGELICFDTAGNVI